MPSSGKAVKCMLEAIPKDFSGKIIDLGSGWGTLVFPLAERFPNSQVVGYENSPIPYLFTKIRQFLRPLPNLVIRRTDFFKESLEDANLIFCYLYSGEMQMIKDHLLGKLSPGTWIISNTFAMPGLKSVSTYILDDLYKTRVYVYRI